MGILSIKNAVLAGWDHDYLSNLGGSQIRGSHIRSEEVKLGGQV